MPAPGATAAALVGRRARLHCVAKRAAARTPTVARRRGPLRAVAFAAAARVAAGLKWPERAPYSCRQRQAHSLEKGVSSSLPVDDERGPLLELLAKKREIALHGALAVCNGNVEPRKFAEAENLQWWWLVRRRRSRRSGARGSLHGPGCAPVVARFFCLKEPPNRNRSGARIPPSTATPFAVHPDA